MKENITLSRVDYRLIHGQVMTKWLKISLAKKIIIVDDILAQEQYMIDIYKMSAPSDVTIDIFTLAEIKEKLELPEFKNSKLFLLFKDIKNARKTFEAGVNFPNLQIGGVPKSGDKKMIFKAVSLDTEDIENLKFLEQNNVEITLQIIPEESKLSLKEAIEKFNNI